MNYISGCSLSIILLPFISVLPSMRKMLFGCSTLSGHREKSARHHIAGPVSSSYNTDGGQWTAATLHLHGYWSSLNLVQYLYAINLPECIAAPREGRRRKRRGKKEERNTSRAAPSVDKWRSCLQAQKTNGWRPEA